jgi:putative peptidoglycan lipid II flippase
VQIVVLLAVWALDWELDDAARALAWALTAGGLAQLLVQLPTTLRLARGVRLHLGRDDPQVAEVRRRFLPAVLGRGVIQLSAYLDLLLASFLAGGALAALLKAQLLYTLPVSLFAMSVAAAELPELSRLTDDPRAMAARSTDGLRRIAFLMLLATLLYVAAGDLIVAVLFQGGRFDGTDTVLVWLVLAAYAIGLPAVGTSRMLQNVCFAAGDTAGPARIATVRVAVSATLGLLLMFPLDRVIVGPDGLEGLGELFGLAGPLDEATRSMDTVRLGAVGLALGSAVAAWVELSLLSVLATRHLPGVEHPMHTLRRPATAAAIAFLATAVVKLVVGDLPALVAAGVTVGTGVTVYAVTAFRTGVDESRLLLTPARRLIWR